MDKDVNYYYKTCDFMFKDNKEKNLKDINNEYGYNFETIKRSQNEEDYSKIWLYNSKEGIKKSK